MPRGHKSKSRSRGARHHNAHARGESQGPQGAQPTEKKESASTPAGQANSSCSFGASTPQRAVVPASPKADVSCTGTEQGVCVDVESPCAFQAEEVTQPICKDALTGKASMLVEFLLEKFQKSEQFTEADMLKVMSKKYKTRFPDILRKSSFRLEMIFGMQLKKINASNHSYAIVSKLGLSTAEILSGKRGLPKMGLLMSILGLIFAKGNRATEAEIWQFLNMLGVYSGKKHMIFGEPRKLITNDLVEQSYLEIRKVSEDKPLKYDFLWGSRAYAETSKMKVLEVWAKINDTVPTSFPSLYEEALKDQTERAERRAAALGCTVAMARVNPRCMSCGASYK